jgi:hypothetical protein
MIRDLDMEEEIENGAPVCFFRPHHVTVWRKGTEKLWHVIRPIEQTEQRLLLGERGYIAELRAFADSLERFAETGTP